MERFQNIAGDPAYAYIHLPTSNETTSTYSNEGLHQHSPRSSLYQSPHDLSHSEESIQLHDNELYNQYFGHAELSDANINHPLTPPRQGDEEQRLREWYAQQNAQRNSAPYQIPFPVTQQLGYGTQIARPSYVDPSSMPPRRPRSGYVPPWPPDGIFAPAPMLQDLNNTGRLQNMHLPPYAGAAQHHAHGHEGFQARNVHGRRRTEIPAIRDPRVRLRDQCAQRRLPPVGNFQSPPTRSPYELHPPSTLSVQRYPTSSPFQQDSSHVTPHQPRISSSHDGPSPGHDGITPPDKKLREKKEAYHRKAEEARLQRQIVAAKRATAKRPNKSATVKRKKRKTAKRSADVSAATSSQSHRPSKPSRNHSTQSGNSFGSSGDLSPNMTPHQYHCHQNKDNMTLSHMYTSDDPFGKPCYYTPIKTEPGVEGSKTLETDFDDETQKITIHYEYYKWSVTLYEVNHNDQYDYAQSWLEDLFASNLPPDKYRWESHATWGFIKDGGRLSFLAIHNATDPFSTHSIDSTTSIGVYGYYWHKHAEIHWKTFGPDIRWLLDWCVANNGITVKQKWKVDMPRASDRRFHRAYWLAANRKHLNNLLNHSEDMVDTPHDAVGDVVYDESECGSGNLTNEWDITMEEAEEAWKAVLDENEFRGDDGALGYQHVITGRSEGW